MAEASVQEAYWLVRDEGAFLVSVVAGAAPFHKADWAGAENPGVVALGEWEGVPCFAVERAAATALLDVERIDPSREWLPLRAIFGAHGEAAFALAGRASLLLDWQRNHRYCGRCATPTERQTHEYSQRCPTCGLIVYPRISPAVMVLVRDGARLLLARSPRFKPGVFSALAGFVEAGESLEDCARREVREEVGVEIANLRYFRSQPWPFPDSLMLAFFADYAGGELCLDPSEIETAGWFTLDALPILPDPVSIARRLIDAACAEMCGAGAGPGSSAI